MTTFDRPQGRFHHLAARMSIASVALAGIGIAAAMTYAMTGGAGDGSSAEFARPASRPIVIPSDDALSRLAAELAAKRAAAFAANQPSIVIPTEDQLARTSAEAGFGSGAKTSTIKLPTTEMQVWVEPVPTVNFSPELAEALFPFVVPSLEAQARLADGRP